MNNEIQIRKAELKDTDIIMQFNAAMGHETENFNK
jgi:hypothetical protein